MVKNGGRGNKDDRGGVPVLGQSDLNYLTRSKGSVGRAKFRRKGGWTWSVVVV